MQRSAQVGQKPVASQIRGGLQGSRLLEQVSRPRYDVQPARAAQPLLRSSVQREDLRVTTADDQQRGRLHERKHVPGKVRSSSSRDHRGDLCIGVRGSHQGGGCASAGSEVTGGQVFVSRFGRQPAGDLDKAAGEQLDVEDVRPVDLLGGREQIEEQRSQAGAVEHVRDVPVTWAVTAAAAAVGEQHEPARVFRNGEMPGERSGSSGNVAIADPGELEAEEG